MIALNITGNIIKEKNEEICKLKIEIKNKINLVNELNLKFQEIENNVNVNDVERNQKIDKINDDNKTLKKEIIFIKNKLKLALDEQFKKENLNKTVNNDLKIEYVKLKND